MKLYLPIDMKEFPHYEGVEVTYYNQDDQSVIEAEIFVGSSSLLFTQPEKFKNLKFLQLLSSGYDHVPVESLTSMGVMIANGRGLYSSQIAEYCMAHILSNVKQLNVYREAQANMVWRPETSPTTLQGKTALILGTGSIAYELAKRLRCFDVKVIGVNSNGRSVEGFDECLDFDGALENLGKCDFVISTLPSSKRTYHCINAAFLKAMKDDAILINVGRGDVLDTSSLEDNIDHLGQVISDVFEEEPLPKTSFLWSHPKVTVTPHISFMGDLNVDKKQALVVNNIRLYLEGNVVSNLINKPKGGNK